MPKIKAVVINSAKARNDNFNVIALINPHQNDQGDEKGLAFFKGLLL